MKTCRLLLYCTFTLVVCALALPDSLLFAQTGGQSKVPYPKSQSEPPSPDEQEMKRLMEAGKQFYDKDQFPEAMKAYEAGLAIAERLKNEQSMAANLNGIGNVQRSLRQLPKALEAYQRALMHAEKSNSVPDIASSLDDIGRVYADLIQYDRALESYQRALTLYEKLGNQKNIAESLNRIGTVYGAQGQYNSPRKSDRGLS